MGDNMHMEIQEDEEDDDLDFNPLLRGETPSEASSSLSSENEGPCDAAVKHIQISLDEKMGTPSSKPVEKIESYSQECVNEDEEIIMQFDVASGKSTKQLQLLTCTESCIKGISAESGSDDAGIPTMKDLIDVISHQENNNEPVVNDDGGGDDDDAICRRTRARHSLADYTLEELETFLQESDDDDDLHNVDDQEEYHKFLAAVLLEGDGDVQVGQGEIPFDEDEENDADFEIELEEALESDVDETSGCITEHQTKQLVEIRIPETRQKKRLKETAKRKKFVSGQSKTSLRPILPYTSNSQRPPFPSFAWQMPSTNHFSHCSTSVPGADLINGFTAYQVGQLYCLIHEHVQLLLQIFSVSVLDPSRQLVANDLLKLISEMIERHEMALSWRKIPYPLHCFRSPNLHNSLQVDSNQTSSYWAPVIDNPIISILDLAPLRLAKHFMADVAETASRYRLSFLEDGLLKNHSSKEPLFSLPISVSRNNEGSEVLGGSMDVSPCSSSGQQLPKKSLAATLVESTMKQSVALVPAGIAKLAQRFFHLFNAALFPHKPPTLAVANRILFTDAEDGLLAMGIMEHNNDWLAIQQHFLPCKSKHQIFVRQKNRSSSKAPENPIKAVRRMKGSPLTEDEKALISEGLRIFKHDWLSVWKYFVPHRDPSMLPRQWRIATGTQKSYKKSEAVKEKRRIYEARRRRMKACLTDTQTSEKEVNDGDDSDSDLDCGDEAYVHEAFLEDPEPGNSKNLFQNVLLPSINGDNTQAIRPMQYKDSGNDSGEAQVATGNVNMLLNSSKQPKDVHSLHQFSQIRYGASYSISSKHLSSCSISGTSGGHFVTQSYRARKRKGLRVVKLAPDLPPVNLPPSVRVISQSAFKIYHAKSLHSNVHNNVLKNHALEVARVSEVGVSAMNNIESTRKLQEYHSSNPHSDVGSLASQAKENASEFDAQLHPLLFQNPSHFSFNCQSTAPSSYDFFLGSHCSVSTVSIAVPENSRGESGPPVSSTIDFHPLLQRPENSSDEPAVVNSQPSQLQYEQANNLDLNIHPSSSVDRQRTNEVCDHQNVELNAYTPLKRGEKVVQGSLRPFDLVDEELEDSRGTNLVVQSTTFYSRDGFDLETVPQSHDISCHKYIQDFREESNPGIVMEQEELSDSEDESENVVFEHEDLEDSEDDESFGEPIKIHNKVPGIGGKEEETQAPRDLHQLLQSSFASTASVKRRKGFRDAAPPSPALPRSKLTRSKNENCGTKGDGFFRSSNRSRKRADDENSMPQDLGVRAVESRVAGSRRSKRRPPSD